nr:MAG TPA: hypothetical protein [Microviridae sp.]
MKTFSLSELELVNVRVAITRRMLDLRLKEVSMKRLELPCSAVHAELLSLDSILSKLG